MQFEGSFVDGVGLANLAIAPLALRREGRARLDCHIRSCLWYNFRSEKISRQSS